MHDERTAHAKGAQRMGNVVRKTWVGDAEYAVAGSGGIGQRTENVEDRTNANLAAQRRGELHRRMVRLREHEPNADLFDTLRHRIRAELDLHPKRLQNVGAATGAAHSAITVLCHGLTGGRQDDSVSRGDIEGTYAVTTGATGVGNRLADRDRQRFFAHNGQATGDFISRFSLNPDRRYKRAELRRCARSLHYFGHHSGCFFTRKRCALRSFDGGFNNHHSAPCCAAVACVSSSPCFSTILRKFCRSFLPSTVRMDSG